MPSDKTPEILTPPKIAEKLGVKPETVIGWIKSGELAGFNVASPGKRPRYRVSAEALEAFTLRRTPEKVTIAPRKVLCPARSRPDFVRHI